MARLLLVRVGWGKLRFGKGVEIFLTNREGAKGAEEAKKEGGLSLIEWLYNRDI
jgi:hypothetical protein